MSVAINYEEVAKDLALKLANVEFQLASYKNLIQQLEKEITSPDRAEHVASEEEGRDE